MVFRKVMCRYFSGLGGGVFRWAFNQAKQFAASRHAGVQPKTAIDALRTFRNVKRRLETIAQVRGITVYDDFAHHPTAIQVTLEALRSRIAPNDRLIAVLEPRSNTMKMGVHRDRFANALSAADMVVMLQPQGMHWDLSSSTESLGNRRRVFQSVEEIILHLCAVAEAGDHIVLMSNGGFGDIYRLLPQALSIRPGVN